MSENAAPSTHLSWHQSLRWRLGLINFLLMLALAAAALWVNHEYVQKRLAADSDALAATNERYLATALSAPLETAEKFSQSLAAIALADWGDATGLRRQAAAILARITAEDAIVAAGIWPAPRRFSPAAERSSFYWTIDASGPQFHGDYNNPANISYHGEPWYSPLSFYQGRSCFWTSRYTEPFLQRPVISCAVPIWRAQEFLGVSSVVLDPSRLTADLAALGTGAAFYLLLDRDQQILQGAGLKFSRGDNVADLAKTDPRFGSVAIQLYQSNQTRIAAARATDEQLPRKVQELVAKSRQLPSLQAEALLATLTVLAPEQPERMAIDAAGGQIDLRIKTLPAGDWTLLVGRDGSSDIAGLPQTTWIGIASTGGMVALALLLFSALQARTIFRPLRRLVAQLDRPAEDSLVEATGSGEINQLSQHINIRHERIRELTTRMRAARYDPTSGRPMRPDIPTPEQLAQGSGWRVLDGIPDAVVVTDSEGRIKHLNSAAQALCGWNLGQALKLNFDEVFHLISRHGKNRLVEIAVKASRSSQRSERPITALFKTRSGHELPVGITTAPIPGESPGTADALVILHDARITAASPQGEVAAPQMRDALTGVLNRQAFDAELANRCEATRLGGAANFFLVYADIDGMQRINDACGSEGGDELLRQFGRLMQNDVGRDHPIYRVQADKFACLLTTPDKAEAQVTAELLRADTQSWGFRWKNQSLEISLTIALVEVDRNSGRALDVLRTADQQCQAAKVEGRGRVVTALARPPRGEQRDDRQWIAQIKQGLTQDRFHLSTQQVKSLQRGANNGEVFASLLALEDDEGFWNSAEAFMPVAERHKLSGQLDRWIIEQVFSRLAGEAGLADKLAFCMLPLTGSSVQSGLDFILERFNEHRIAPAKICFELREGDVHSRLSSAREFITALSRAGCRFCLSEVSTRPASYSLMRELPIDLVKFDPLLTRRADSDPVDRLAVESLHKIARTLNKRTVATDIGSTELLRVMQGIGIDFALGNAVARATPLLFQIQA